MVKARTEGKKLGLYWPGKKLDSKITSSKTGSKNQKKNELKGKMSLGINGKESGRELDLCIMRSGSINEN